jgi:hypothetical protein
MQRITADAALLKAGLVALVLLVEASLARGGEQGVAPLELLPHPPPVTLMRSTAPAARWMGVHSCTARACHGNPGDERVHPAIWGNEHAIWQERDKHARAYRVLFDKPAIEMAERLGLPPAHKAKQCLACHAPAASQSHADASLLTEGVSCEACHGAAGKWLVAHTSAGWKGLDPQRKHRDYGLLPTKDLVERARLCADCHVGAPDRDGDGSPDRDVNHDLIAAGHPRLTFEFASHLARLPTHWSEKGPNDRRQYGDFEARAWVIGRAVGLKAGLDLLSARAAAADAGHAGAAWPEFSEYHCFSCHRELPAGRNPQPGLGLASWNSWNRALLPLLTEQTAGNIDLLSSVEAVSQSMLKLNNDPGQTALQAAEASRDLDLWLTHIADDRYDLASIRHWQRMLSSAGRQIDGEPDWDQAAQLYLGLAAMQQSSLDTRRRFDRVDVAMHDALSRTRRILLFPAPSSGERRLFDSPRAYSWPATRDSLDAIERLLSRQERP